MNTYTQHGKRVSILILPDSILLLALGLNWGDSIVAFQPQSDPYSMSLVTFGL